MMKNPEVLGQCQGGPGGEEKRKGKEERRGREGSRERRARARGAFCGVERRRICFTLQRILAPICEILKNNLKKILVWRRCREEGIELGGGVLGGLDGFGKRRSRRRRERRVGRWEEKRECGFRASLIVLGGFFAEFPSLGFEGRKRFFFCFGFWVVVS